MAATRPPRAALLLLLVAGLATIAATFYGPPDAPLPDDGERMIDRRFQAAPGGTLEVRVADADFHIETGAGREARVEVFLAGRDMERARRYFEELQFRVEQHGETIRIATTEPQHPFSVGDRTGGAQILVRITLPETFHADVQTADGDITLGRLRGRVSLRTSDGDLRVAPLEGPRLSLRTSDGDIRAETLTGEHVEVHTSDGDIALREADADVLSVRTSDGDISLDQARGRAEIVTSDGDLSLGQVSGPRLLLRTSDGSISVRALSAEAAEVRTSDGNITLDRVDGPLRAATSSGSIRVQLLKSSPVSLQTSDGDIYVSAPHGLAADLRLRGQAVRIAAAYRFDGTVQEEAADGRLNGGGPLLEARTASGTVTLQPR